MKDNKLIMVVLIALISVSAALAAYDSIPALEIDMLNQDPDPAGPGSYVDVRFKVFNDGVAEAEDVKVELMPQYPFSLDSNEKALRELGTVPGYGESRAVQVVKYKVRIADDAVEGENTLLLRYKIGDFNWITAEYNIDVQTVDATVAIDSVETVPDRIKPGEAAKVKITLKNMADSLMQDVSLKLDLGLSTVTIPATASELSYYDSIPFAPIQSVTEKKVRQIKSGDEVTFTYDIIAYPDAEPRVYKVPIQIKYYDELETEYVKNDIIGLVVGTKPDLTIEIDETTLHKGVESGDVVIKLINKGFTDIKFLDVKLGESPDYEIISSDDVYIGNIDSDDYETAEFQLFVNQDQETDEEKTLILPISVEYKDANTEEYTDTVDLELKLYDPHKLGMGNGGPNFTLFFVVIVVVVGGYIIIRRKKKKKA